MDSINTLWYFLVLQHGSMATLAKKSMKTFVDKKKPFEQLFFTGVKKLDEIQQLQREFEALPKSMEEILRAVRIV